MTVELSANLRPVLKPNTYDGVIRSTDPNGTSELFGRDIEVPAGSMPLEGLAPSVIGSASFLVDVPTPSSLQLSSSAPGVAVTLPMYTATHYVAPYAEVSGATSDMDVTNGTSFSSATSPSSPCTYGEALANATAGDVVELAPGVYWTTDGPSAYLAGFRPTNSGTFLLPIIFFARYPASLYYDQPSLRSEVRKTGTDTPALGPGEGCNYIIFDGIYINEEYVYPAHNEGCVIIRNTGCEYRRMAFDRYTGRTYSSGDNANCLMFHESIDGKVFDCRFNGKVLSSSHNNGTINIYNSKNYLITHCYFEDGYTAVYSKENCYRVGFIDEGTPTNDIALIVEDGGVFTDYTDELNEYGSNYVYPFPSPEAVDDALYIGAEWKFFGADVIAQVQGVATAASTVWEYWNGSSWVALSGVIDQTDSGNGAFTASTVEEYVEWEIPSDWATTTVTNQTHSGALYYVRVRVTGANYSTVPQLDRVLIQLCEADSQFLTDGEISYNHFKECTNPVQTQQGILVRIHHNLMEDVLGSYFDSGWWIDYGPNRQGLLEWQFFNNTIVLSSTGANGLLIEDNPQLSNIAFKNNIVYAPSGHTGYMVSSAAFDTGSMENWDWSDFSVIDYNCYYMVGGGAPRFYGRALGSGMTGLSNWQTETGDEGNSITSDPEFVDAANGDYRLANNSQEALTAGDTGGRLGCYELGTETIGIRANYQYLPHPVEVPAGTLTFASNAPTVGT